MRSLLIIVIAIASHGTLNAQHQHHAGSAETEKKAALDPGLGSHHRPVSTKNPEAQKFFDQGLTLTFSFNHDAAIRAFSRAAELDPNLAMAHWGIAYALGPNINMDIDPPREKKAWEHVQTALKLAANAPEHEQAWIRTLARRYSNQENPDRAKLNRTYADAMRALVSRYPDDLDAATLYAEALMDLRPWKLWKKDGTPEDGTEEIVRVLESVLRRDPMHPGANHFYIHAVEASPTPERALPSAERLKSLVPNAGHMVHMPAHIFMRTGDYRQANEANARGVDADRRYIAQYGADGMYAAMYYNHNLHFLASAAAMEGRFNEAMTAARELAKNAAPIAKEMSMIQGPSQWPVFMLARFGRWKDILAMDQPDAGPQAEAVFRFGRGLALSAQKNVRSAREEQTKFNEAVSLVGENDTFMLNTGRDVMAVAELILRARISEAEGDMEQALNLYRRAARLEDNLAYDEPADWPNPVRENLGGLLLRLQRYQDAEGVFRDDLERNPRSGRSLFGLMKALEGQKKTVAADAIRVQFERAWSRADAPLRIEDL